MHLRVDLCDPSSDGPWILEQLWQEGFDVRRIGLEEVSETEAALVLIAGDAPGALRALKALRDDDERGDVPVILLGAPAGFEHRGGGPGLGADAVFARPVALAALIARARELLEHVREAPEVSRVSAPVERTMRLPDESSQSGEAQHTGERAVERADGRDPDSSQVLSVVEAVESISWRPREPTMQLDDLGSDVGLVGEPSAEHSGVSPQRSASTFPGRRRRTGSEHGTPATGPITGADAPQPVIPPGQRAQLSPGLVALLSAADRRVFPDRPPLELHFPAADQSADELVPAELLEVSVRVDEPMIEDPIDAFTYVGGPAVPPPSPSASAADPDTAAASSASEASSSPASSASASAPSSSAPSSSAPSSSASSSSAPGTGSGGRKSEHTTATEVPALEEDTPGSGVHLASAFPATDGAARASWPEEDSVLGRAALDGVRRGALGAGGVLRLLFRVAALGLDAICELSADADLSLRLTFLRGELRAFDGPVALGAARGLHRRGRLTPTPDTEAAAAAVLEGAVDDGSLGRFERDRLLRESREALLTRAVASERAEFILRRLDDTEPGRALSRAHVFARPLRAALVDAARVALSAERVAAMIGVDSLGEVGVGLGPQREAGLGPVQLPGELVQLLVRHEGHSLRALLDAAPSEPGLPGLVYALFAGDLLMPAKRAVESAASNTRATRELVEAAASRAADGDYFAILGLELGASAAEVARAFALRRAELSALDLGAMGLAALEDPHAAALDALDEAHSVLSNERLRAAYARALSPAPV